MDQQRAVRRRPAAEHADRLAVDAGGQRFFLLGTVDRGVRGGIDDHLRPHAVEQGGQRCGDRQVGGLALAAVRQCAVPGGDGQLAAGGQAGVVKKRAAELAVGAEQQDPHGV